jgi:hypothetical protein
MGKLSFLIRPRAASLVEAQDHRTDKMLYDLTMRSGLGGIFSDGNQLDAQTIECGLLAAFRSSTSHKAPKNLDELI